MARARRQPLLRLKLYPFVETWSAGPALTYSLVRFGLPAGIRTVSADADPAYRGCTALASAELPFTIVPRSVVHTGQIETQQPDAPWRTRPAPPWRGVPTRFATISLRFSNEVSPEEPATFPVLAVIAEADPPGPPPRHILLGAEFLTHYALRVVVDYGAVHYLGEEGTARRIDPSVSCGWLEKD